MDEIVISKIIDIKKILDWIRKEGFNFSDGNSKSINFMKEDASKGGICLTLKLFGIGKEKVNLLNFTD